MYCTWKKIKMSYKNNKFQISSARWKEKFQLPDGSYYVSYIQDYFEYIIKKHLTVTANPPIRIYVNKVEKKVTFRIKEKYYLKMLSPETMKLSVGTKSKITKDENSEKIPHLEITEVVLVNCNIVNNDYKQNSRRFDTLVPNKFIWSIIRYLA